MLAATSFIRFSFCYAVSNTRLWKINKKSNTSRGIISLYNPHSLFPFHQKASSSSTFTWLRSQYPFPGDVKVAQEDRNCCLIGLMREELINGGFIGNNLETRNRQSLKFGFNEFIAAPFGALTKVVSRSWAVFHRIRGREKPKRVFEELSLTLRRKELPAFLTFL